MQEDMLYSQGRQLEVLAAAMKMTSEGRPLLPVDEDVRVRS